MKPPTLDCIEQVDGRMDYSLSRVSSGKGLNLYEPSKNLCLTRNSCCHVQSRVCISRYCLVFNVDKRSLPRN